MVSSDVNSLLVVTTMIVGKYMVGRMKKEGGRRSRQPLQICPGISARSLLLLGLHIINFRSALQDEVSLRSMIFSGSDLLLVPVASLTLMILVRHAFRWQSLSRPSFL